jgi:hypothetical protein
MQGASNESSMVEPLLCLQRRAAATAAAMNGEQMSILVNSTSLQGWVSR